MEPTQTQENTDYRSQLAGRMKTRFADRNFDSTDGQNSPDNLEQSILEALTEDETTISDLTAKNREYEESAGKVSSLFNNSPRAALFLNTLAASKDPSAAIYKAYGREAYDAFRDGDASELIASIEAEDAKNRAENEQFEAEKAANLKESFAALDAWGNEKGLNDDQKVETFMRFYDILSDALLGKYSSDLFEMGWKADHYAGDVASARQEGEVAGRNANIMAQQRKREVSRAMPPSLSGQGVREPEARPAREDFNPWML